LIAVSQTPENAPNSPSDVERVRKVYAKDVKNGSTLNTVFRVTDKERHTARSGKSFLSLTLFDKTGTLDARIFDNVDAAEAAFQNDDFLLVAGKLIAFHGKPQLVIEKLEKLDAGPIDAKEFAPPPSPPSAPSPAESGPRMSKHLRQRLIALLDDPAVSSGLEALVKHLERYIDDRIAERTGGGERERKAVKPQPKVEHRPRAEEREKEKEKEKPAARDSGLPKDLAFKPFNALAPAAEPQPEQKSAENSPTPSSGS
jgi:RecG-like helicase